MEESVLPLESVAAFGSKYSGMDARYAARQALVHVRRRVEQAKTHSVLLRASEDSSNQEATLLRSSIAPTAIDAATLLRTPEEQEVYRVGS
jgi:hypothetical protein